MNLGGVPLGVFCGIIGLVVIIFAGIVYRTWVKCRRPREDSLDKTEQVQQIIRGAKGTRWEITIEPGTHRINISPCNESTKGIRP